jgi:replication factor A1
MTPGSYVTLRNAKIDMYRGSMRLAVNQVRAGWGGACGRSMQRCPPASTRLLLRGAATRPPPVPQWGKMEAASGHSFEPKHDFNLSLVEFELVPVPQPEKPPAQAEEATQAPPPPAAEPEEAAANGTEGFEAAEAPPSS